MTRNLLLAIVVGALMLFIAQTPFIFAVIALVIMTDIVVTAVLLQLSNAMVDFEQHYFLEVTYPRIIKWVGIWWCALIVTMPSPIYFVASSFLVAWVIFFSPTTFVLRKKRQLLEKEED